MKRVVTALLALVLAVVSAGPPAWSAPRPRTDARVRAEARAHFDKAQKLFALARFADAIVEYQAAFELTPLPELLLNIAQCHRNLDELDDAVFGYRKYLQLAPRAQNRAEIEQLIAELEAESKRRRDQARADEEAAQAREAAAAQARIDASLTAHPPPAPAPARPVYRRWWFITGAVVVAAAATGAAVVMTRDRLPGSDLGTIDFTKR